MKLWRVRTSKYFTVGIFLVLTVCIYTDGRTIKKSLSNSSISFYNCADEVDQWNCNEESSDEEECVKKDDVCNGNYDCADGEDEEHCTCGDSGVFECPNGDCFPESFHCDGDNDCEDWADEGPECSNDPCKSDYFRCENGRCIENREVCDGEDDCGDNSDEMYRQCIWNNSNDEWYITLVVIGVLLFLVVLCSVVTTKYRRVRRNNRSNTSASTSRDPGRTISMELTLPSGPPSYEATMSATMSVNPAYADENSSHSGYNPADDDLPPPYESIANENVESEQGLSRSVANETHDQQGTGQNVSETALETEAPSSVTGGTAPAATNNSADESSSSLSSSSTSPEPFYEPVPALDDEGRHI